MKKTLLLGMLALAGFSANAQLASGSQAPDFTATDINGVEHHLQTYLDQGKTVVLDVSATWCGPCWSFHSAHILEELYKSHGPEGSDEVVILFIEGDGSTSISDLNGETAQTQGDWVTGTKYPIIDSAAIANLYDIAYFPTLYRICPDGLVYEMNQANPLPFLEGVSNCGSIDGAENHAEVEKTSVSLCEATGATNFDVEIKNYGGNNLTSAELSLKEDGTVIATQTYSGDLSLYTSGTVSFEGVEFDTSKDHTIEFTQINGSEPFNSVLESNTVDVSVAGQAENNFLVVLVHTDNYPGEISWDIKDSNGNVVANGGPYQAGTGTAGAGGPDANTTKMHFVEIPEGTSDCFDVNMYDAYGDGWSLGNTWHGMEVYSNDTAVFAYGPGNFGTELTRASAFKTNGVLASETIETSTFAVYPNPSNGVFNFATQEAVAVTVMDLTGKVVFTAKEINNGDTMNLSNLQKGMYLAKIVGATGERTEKLVIK
ncbi:T9SS C-terminal target domain-containing protein [Flavobacterium arcticum]|uniref:T9SS C-terminal target domain-containing protein n=1 Tax=Flavobacterium arcticum TaxID=1784713 RepID=A0A345HA79_9FLAO|nr:T9SS type A sorting domain-containing protein [Flavobacterium arcticum]AXG73489.1 T9SS C-terminal target domain-containing protein [Flavobacterium arcticum]KAF2513278.1 T9SS type A sorting domain-containing protein [Flavobacterium arcticum]